MEHVRHTVHEDHGRLLPRARQVDPLRPQPNVEALLVRVPGHAAEALRELPCVTSVAARTHLDAARGEVQRLIRPADRRVTRHPAPPRGSAARPPGSRTRYRGSSATAD